MNKNYNVNCPHPDGSQDQILLGTDTGDDNQSLEDAAYHALGIMVSHWDNNDYDRATYSISYQGNEQQE